MAVNESCRSTWLFIGDLWIKPTDMPFELVSCEEQNGVYIRIWE